MANMVNYVRFQRGTVEAYEALKTAGTLDNNTLYFIYEEGNENTGALYMGTRFIGGNNAGKMNLDDLADVIVAEAGTNSFLVKNAEGQWVAKSLADVVDFNNYNLARELTPSLIVPDCFSGICMTSGYDERVSRAAGSSRTAIITNVYVV